MNNAINRGFYIKDASGHILAESDDLHLLLVLARELVGQHPYIALLHHDRPGFKITWTDHGQSYNPSYLALAHLVCHGLPEVKSIV